MNAPCHDLLRQLLAGLRAPARPHRRARGRLPAGRRAASARSRRRPGQRIAVEPRRRGRRLRAASASSFEGDRVVPRPPVGRRVRRPRPAAASNLGPDDPELLAAIEERQRRGRGRGRASTPSRGARRRGHRLGLRPRPVHLARRTPSCRSRGSPRQRGSRRRTRSGRWSTSTPRAGRSASSASRGSTCSSSTSPSSAPLGAGDLSDVADMTRWQRGSCGSTSAPRPGVGKTFAMLDEGQRRAERGTDVVVGFVETHGRPQTEAQSATSRSCPAGSVDHRGTAGRGDGPRRRARPAARRRPGRRARPHQRRPGTVATRSAGRTSRRCSTPGIDVITTVNVQHLESLNDVVESITGDPAARDRPRRRRPRRRRRSSWST